MRKGWLKLPLQCLQGAADPFGGFWETQKQKFDLATNQLAIGPDCTKFKTALNCCRYERRKL
jgi:hypothetical protein